MKKTILGVLLGVAAFALDTSKLKPQGYVSDFGHALGAQGLARLESYCARVERATGAQFAVVTVDTLEDEPIEDVANRLYHEWGIGKKGKDEGILLLVAIKDHKQRAEIGYGLEGIIPDGYAGGILRGIRPVLRQGNYAGAILAALQQFGDRIAQEKGVTIEGERRPAGRERTSGGRGGGIPFLYIAGGVLLLLWIAGRFTGGGGGGGGTGFLAGLFLGNLMGRGGSGGWGGGGFGGSGGGGGGGFGGFGGGDSGGGGASSDW